MSLTNDRHQTELRAAGWHSRGYLPHFDGRATPQFLTLHLADSIPRYVIDRWVQELSKEKSETARLVLRRRIEAYLDQGYGQSFLRDTRIATMVQKCLLKFDEERYRLHAWVVMPNHIHILLTRFEGVTLKQIMHSLKSYTAHKANEILERAGQFWMEDYFDRYIRNAQHYRRTVAYIENNPVKARLCREPQDWPFSSAWLKAGRRMD